LAQQGEHEGGKKEEVCVRYAEGKRGGQLSATKYNAPSRRGGEWGKKAKLPALPARKGEGKIGLGCNEAASVKKEGEGEKKKPYFLCENDLVRLSRAQKKN